ncbi:MAG: hypothetical protein OSB70_06375 [Myxococcota bacterium]|nr:hypothetical protein [Myxococcota bacterium]
MSHGRRGRSKEPERGSPLRAGLLGLIAVLYLFSVPWYRADDQPLKLLFGLPDWVAVAVICYGLVAILNSLAWARTVVDDAAPLPDTLRNRSDDAEASARAREAQG